MSSYIDKTAIIDWDTVTIGPYCYIGPYCVLKNCELTEHVRLAAHVCIGGDPEIRNYSDPVKPVVIKNTKVSEFVTIHAGSKHKTIVNDSLIFRHAHIAHDCFVEGAIIGGGVSLAGHCRVLKDAVISGGSTLHQFCVVGQGAFIGAGCNISKHVKPFVKIMSRSPAPIGFNDIVFKGKSYNEIEQADEEFLRLIEREDPTNATNERKVFERGIDNF